MFGLEGLIRQFNRLVSKLEDHANRKAGEAVGHRAVAADSMSKATDAEFEAKRASAIAGNVCKLIEA